jgi:hypothetical protein
MRMRESLRVRGWVRRERRGRMREGEIEER